VKWAALAVAGMLAACAAHGEREPRPAVLSPVPPSSPAPRAPSPGVSEPAGADADRVVAEALELVGKVRELPAKAPVDGLRMQRPALRAEVERLLLEETPAEALAGNAELLFALDTVPGDFDLRATLGLLYAEQLAGFYDPKAKRMVLAADLGEDAERMTLYHELVHALQDQYFDLGRSLDFRPEQSDVQAALHALAEGDATSAMIAIFAASRGLAAGDLPSAALQLDSLIMQAAPGMTSVPGIIARSLVAPYADGLDFVRYLRQHASGWAGVDRAFRAPPASTEQILHPEKYLAAEAIIALPAPQGPSGFPEASFRDVTGEQGLRLLFEEWAPTREAASAASDWGGDRIALFVDGHRRLVLWHLAFDSEAAARRALVLFARGALRPELSANAGDPRLRAFTPRPEAEAAARAGKLCRQRADRGAFAIVRHGRHLGVTLGPYLRGVTPVRGPDTCSQALAWAQAVAAQR
jgi:hypothetical protein